MDYEMIHAATVIRYKTSYEQQVSNLEPIFKIKDPLPTFIVLAWSGDRFVWTEAEFPRLETYEDYMVKLSFVDTAPFAISPKTTLAGKPTNNEFVTPVGFTSSSPRPGQSYYGLDSLDQPTKIKQYLLENFSLGNSKDPVGIPSWSIRVPAYKNLVLGNGLIVLTK
jgi:hypothetical protein